MPFCVIVKIVYFFSIIPKKLVIFTNVISKKWARIHIKKRGNPYDNIFN